LGFGAKKGFHNKVVGEKVSEYLMMVWENGEAEEREIYIYIYIQRLGREVFPPKLTEAYTLKASKHL
jgi:hypothetical protein